MAFLHDYSDAAKNLGRWEPFIFDDERNLQVSLRVKRLGREERKRLEKPFLRPQKRRRGGAKTLVVPDGKLEEFGVECAMAIWTDVRNGYVRVEDDLAAKFYTDEGIPAKKGDEIRLDNKLTRDIKLRLIDQDNSIAVFISNKGISLDDEAVEEAEEEAEVEEVAIENLKNG